MCGIVTAMGFAQTEVVRGDSTLLSTDGLRVCGTAEGYYVSAIDRSEIEEKSGEKERTFLHVIKGLHVIRTFLHVIKEANANWPK